jgi:hypothetical protein
MPYHQEVEHHSLRQARLRELKGMLAELGVDAKFYQTDTKMVSMERSLQRQIVDQIRPVSNTATDAQQRVEGLEDRADEIMSKAWKTLAMLAFGSVMLIFNLLWSVLTEFTTKIIVGN